MHLHILSLFLSLSLLVHWFLALSFLSPPPFLCLYYETGFVYIFFVHSQEVELVSTVSSSGVESDQQRLSQDITSDLIEEDDDVFLDALRLV